MQRFGHLDVLASVAGVADNAPLESSELADWDQIIDVNLRAVLHGIAAAMPVFRAQSRGTSSPSRPPRLVKQGRGGEAERLRRFGLNPDGSIAWR